MHSEDRLTLLDPSSWHFFSLCARGVVGEGTLDVLIQGCRVWYMKNEDFVCSIA